MYFQNLCLIGLLLLGVWACNDSSKPKPPTATPAPTTSPAAPAPGTAKYPPITEAEMKILWDSTTAVDYLFYKLPLSMSMTERPAIENVLRQVDPRPGLIIDACKPMGRVFFQNNGQNLGEADFFFTETCKYYVFYENQKPVKANQMTPDGIVFFQRLLDSAQNQSPQ
ncbi:MAG: hypothetical protein AAFW73_07005 [Bacteroidota bacterium]